MKPVLITLLTMGLLVSAFALHDEGSLDGAYEFIRVDTPDGPNTDQKGMMIIKDGYICHVRTAKTREKLEQNDAEAEQDRQAAAAFRTANGTCGKYTIEGSKVTLTWMTAVNPNSEGNSSEYVFEREGDNLIIAPAAATQFKFVYRKAD